MDGRISEPVKGYVRRGNIIGTFNDGVTFEDSKIDKQDMCAIYLWYAQRAYHRKSISGKFVLPFTERERADVFRDSYDGIRGDDYNLVRIGMSGI